MVIPPEILAAIDADPTALEPRRVLGDWYATQGDPLGELIALQVALIDAGTDAAPELKAREQALFQQHRERLFGGLREPAAKVFWFAGSWQTVSLFEPVPDLAVVLEHPFARWMTQLVLAQPLALDKLELPTIRTLSIQTLDQRTQMFPSGRRQPRLSSFRFEGARLRLIEPPPLGLSSLWLKGGPSGRVRINFLPGADEITRVNWPTLSWLSIEAGVDDGPLAAILDAGRFPRLNHLRAQLFGPGAWDVMSHAKRPPPLRRLELYDPNFNRRHSFDWVARAFPFLSNIESLLLEGPQIRYVGRGQDVLKADKQWTLGDV